jgi:predicted amidohydrolase YtcJ
MPSGLLVRDCAPGGAGRVDVRLRAGTVVEVGPGLRRDGEAVLDAQGATLLPGLHDHHLHLHALAAALGSVDCGPPAVRSLDALAAALQGGASAGPVRGTGYHESVAGPLDRWVLDGLVGTVPVRVQHRSGAAWFLNSAALAGLSDLDDPAVERDDLGRPTGRLLRGDHLLRSADDPLPDLAPVGRLLASYGVTGVADATPSLAPRALDALRAAHVGGALPQHLLLLGAPLEDRGDDVGPWKVLLDEAAGLDLDGLVEVLRACRAVHRPVAFHAVTTAEAVVAVAALRAVGRLAGDRVEHGSLLPPELDADLRALGVTVVTQPHFVAERGDDYLADVDPRDTGHLYRCASLLAGGVAVATGTDAPYGGLDPWRTVAAAVARRTLSGAVLGAAEQLDADRALGLLQGPLRAPGAPVRRVEPGAAADLVLVDGPREALLREPSAQRVVATVIAGRVAYDRRAG